MLALLSIVLWIVLALLLGVTIVTDLKSRTIPNWLTLMVALLGVAFCLMSGLPFWPELSLRLGQAVLVLAGFGFLFSRGLMGGGDVKLIAALALWFNFSTLVSFLVLMSLLGGVLSLVYLIMARRTSREAPIEVPYGVAIAFAGFWVVVDYLKTTTLFF